MLARTAATVAAIERGDDMDVVRHAVRTFADPLGYDRFVLYTAPRAGRGIVERILWLEGDWFGNGDPVTPETYLARCPVNRHVLETDRAFFWAKTGEGGQETYRVVARPNGPGIKGLQVPVFGHAGLIGAMSLGGRAIDSSVEARLALSTIATATFHSALRLTGSTGPHQVPNLSARELEVVRWIASGRRQADVAVLLNLSERTVENHLRRIRHRLSVSSTAQAVQVLARSGAIDA
ncbi:PA1136 family autoinducer-binding transcriptional regulator [Sphingomonas hankookensis]|uniref:PA1136 family autoinducer-binding transcriptional regulator n=1 Tax=Sphingomonas hankookensis TaxID=563996 RepID=UPI003F7A9164